MTSLVRFVVKENIPWSACSTPVSILEQPRPLLVGFEISIAYTIRCENFDSNLRENFFVKCFLKPWPSVTTTGAVTTTPVNPATTTPRPLTNGKARVATFWVTSWNFINCISDVLFFVANFLKLWYAILQIGPSIGMDKENKCPATWIQMCALITFTPLRKFHREHTGNDFNKNNGFKGVFLC